MNKRNDLVIISIHKTNKLYFAAAFSQKGKIVRIALPKTNLEDLITEISNYHPKFIINNMHEKIVAIIAEIYHGNKSNFDIELLEMDIPNKSSHVTSTLKTNFERDVILEVASIPQGHVRTYKEIATSVKTQGYRAVGTAIGKNPFPIVVPCHRVIRSDGKIGGFRGGKQMKIEMLINEGFKIKSDKILLEK
ncbi:MAG: MGMT family protein [Methanobacterium sp. ERen5]|nr:MAG: MGMT family protein [Methanobacterium sp. ERen5]